VTDSDGIPAGEPGLEHLMRALTANGDARELAGREAALTMFRATRPRPASAASTRGPAGDLTRGAAGDPARGRAASGRPATPAAPVNGHAVARLAESARRGRRHSRLRLRTLALAGGTVIAVVGGLTAGAYAAVLPAPMQHLAYRVFAPLGVPDGRPALAVPGGVTASGTANGHTRGTSPGGAAPSASGSCPCPSGSGNADVLTLRAESGQVATGGSDIFTGQLASNGKAWPGIKVKLLKRVAGKTAWQVADTGKTDTAGQVTLTVNDLKDSAAFRLVTFGGQSVSSPEVVVTVTAHDASSGNSGKNGNSQSQPTPAPPHPKPTNPAPPANDGHSGS
jgi:hypothetical protein